jgi:hypothetical protein
MVDADRRGVVGRRDFARTCAPVDECPIRPGSWREGRHTSGRSRSDADWAYGPMGRTSGVLSGCHRDRWMATGRAKSRGRGRDHELDKEPWKTGERAKPVGKSTRESRMAATVHPRKRGPSRWSNDPPSQTARRSCAVRRPGSFQTTRRHLLHRPYPFLEHRMGYQANRSAVVQTKRLGQVSGRRCSRQTGLWPGVSADCPHSHWREVEKMKLEANCDCDADWRGGTTTWQRVDSGGCWWSNGRCWRWRWRWWPPPG